jgi:hypothetical protein
VCASVLFPLFGRVRIVSVFGGLLVLLVALLMDAFGCKPTLLFFAVVERRRGQGDVEVSSRKVVRAGIEFVAL